MSAHDDETEQFQLREVTQGGELVGSTLGGFRLLAPVGAGGMGAVYRANQLSLDRTVAVKVVQSGDALNRTRFLREAKLISELNHPNIVSVIDSGEEPHRGVMYYAMEYLDGWSLDRILRMGRLHPRVILDLMAQLCSALAEAHAIGVIHRDLKPTNLFVSRGADNALRLRVLDFGIARAVTEESGTATGKIVGTPAFMAPEQLAGEALTPAVDLYPMGMILHTMLAGEHPYPPATGLTLLQQHLQSEPFSLAQYVDQGLVPATLDELRVRLMAKRPADRPEGAAAVRQELVDLQTDAGWSAVLLPGTRTSCWSQVTRPQLSAERERDVPSDWRFEGLGKTTKVESANHAIREAVDRASRPDDADTNVASKLRSSGGWSAFNATPPAEEAQDDHSFFVEAETSSFTGGGVFDPDRGVVDDTATEEAATQRRPAKPPQRGQRLQLSQQEKARQFSADELVPVHVPPRPGTRAKSPTSTIAVGIFIVLFVIFAAGLTWYLGNDAAQRRVPRDPTVTPKAKTPPAPAQKD